MLLGADPRPESSHFSGVVFLRCSKLCNFRSMPRFYEITYETEEIPSGVGGNLDSRDRVGDL